MLYDMYYYSDLYYSYPYYLHSEHHSHCYPTTFTDVTLLIDHVNGKASRSASWEMVQLKHNNRISEERAAHHDMVQLDVIDVYRNLPLKLMESYKW